MVTLNSCVITRFSYRGSDAFSFMEGPTFVRKQDPLNPATLELRFKLFEISCLPSVLGQTDQNFAWIIVIDRELPLRYVERLSSLVKNRKNTHIHIYDPKENLAELRWVSRHATLDGIVITANFDDDDCIPRDFIAAQKNFLLGLQARGALPPIGIIGAKSGLEWDFLPSAAAPLGWKAPWHRAKWTLSVGLTLYCKSPDFDLCVLGLRHTLAEMYLDLRTATTSKHILWFRSRVVEAAAAADIDLARWPANLLFHDISTEVGPVLLTNHSGNDQATRLLEEKPGRVPVTGAADFPKFAIDWDKAREFARSLRPG